MKAGVAMVQLWESLKDLITPQTLISQGWWLLFVVIFAETGIFFGFFLPGDYLLFFAGYFCAVGKLTVSLHFLVISLIVAGILGNYAGYWFGQRAGHALFTRPDSFFFKRKYVHLARDFYEKYGGISLVLGRFFPIIRTFAPILAGIVKVEIKKFTLYNFIGSILWVTSLTCAGYFLSKRYPAIEHNIEYIVLVLILLTSVPILVVYLKKKFVHTDARESGTELK